MKFNKLRIDYGQWLGFDNKPCYNVKIERVVGLGCYIDLTEEGEIKIWWNGLSKRSRAI